MIPTASSGSLLRNMEKGTALGAVRRVLMYSPKAFTSGKGPPRGRYVHNSLSVGEESETKSEGICVGIKGRSVTCFPSRIEVGALPTGMREEVVDAGGPIG